MNLFIYLYFVFFLLIGLLLMEGGFLLPFSAFLFREREREGGGDLTMERRYIKI